MHVGYIDFTEAFDKVPHRRLIHKIMMQGLTVIQSYGFRTVSELMEDRRFVAEGQYSVVMHSVSVGTSASHDIYKWCGRKCWQVR